MCRNNLIQMRFEKYTSDSCVNICVKFLFIFISLRFDIFGMFLNIDTAFSCLAMKPMRNVVQVCRLRNNIFRILIKNRKILPLSLLNIAVMMMSFMIKSHLTDEF